MYLYPRYIRRKIALQGVKIGNIFHTNPRCGKSRGCLNVAKICDDIDIWIAMKQNNLYTPNISATI